ncbi:flagellar FliJ family protein [bacterium AH-315-K20]|nr:flagellar FliJ family protein [bacterium AH-315-K20]
MARFVFELESLLEQRRREERDRMKRVAEVERDRVEIEQEAAALARAFHDEQDALRRELGEGVGVDLGRVRLQSNASLHGLRKRHELALRGAAMLKRLDTARRSLLEATTRRRAVELLRERRYEAWVAAERTKEAREVDELVTARFGRPGTGDGAAA